MQQLPPLAGGEVAVELIEVAQHLMDGGQRQRPPLVRPEPRLLFGDARLEGTAPGFQRLHPVARGVEAGGADCEDGVEQAVALGLVGREVRLEGLQARTGRLQQLPGDAVGLLDGPLHQRGVGGGATDDGEHGLLQDARGELADGAGRGGVLRGGDTAVVKVALAHLVDRGRRGERPVAGGAAGEAGEQVLVGAVLPRRLRPAAVVLADVLGAVEGDRVEDGRVLPGVPVAAVGHLSQVQPVLQHDVHDGDGEHPLALVALAA